MQQNRSDQKGFSIVELLLVAVVICTIGVLGFYVHSRITKVKVQHFSTVTSEVPGISQPPSIPVNHAYLGAFVNPEHLGLGESSDTPGSNVIQQLPAFNQQVGKHLAIIHFYTPFKKALPTSTLNAISANNSIPLISWGCANVASIASGQYDSTINAFADGLKSYNKPVFLRWYWEPNQLNKSGDTPAGSGCDGYNNGSGYITAWQHVYKLFQIDKVTNVAFVWCPGYSGGNFAAYYPGDSYVNWIGLDRYERTQSGQQLLSFSDMFSNYYQQWLSHNKPIMVAETAAMGNSDQPQYLSEIQNNAPQFPDMKAYVYFDATGPAGDWSLKGQGIQAFQTLDSAPYFLN